jgi:hypothetical protein
MKRLIIFCVMMFQFTDLIGSELDFSGNLNSDLYLGTEEEMNTSLNDLLIIWIEKKRARPHETPINVKKERLGFCKKGLSIKSLKI